MEGIEMDEIAVFRCAVRSGYNVRKPSDVTDAMKVEMVRKKSSNVAKYILKECYWLTYDGLHLCPWRPTNANCRSDQSCST